MSEDGLPVTDDLIDLRCISIRSETPNAKTYVFALPHGKAFDFEPGQFLNLIFLVDGREHVRSYSISSSSTFRERVSITVKRVHGGAVSNWLFDNLRVGDAVTAIGAAGIFSCGISPREPILLLTAGSGITPAASMLRSLVDRGSDADIVLVHFATTAEEMIFRDEMAYWARCLSNARIIPVATQPGRHSGWVGASGRLSADLLKGLVPDLKHRQIYCCGPAGFMTAADQIVSGAGVPRDRFFIESFDAQADDSSEVEVDSSASGYVVAFARSGKEAKAGPGTTVLKAAKDADVRILSSCNKGVCGTCRVKLIAGTVEIQHQGGIKEREIDQGYILACCSRPTSDLLVDR